MKKRSKLRTILLLPIAAPLFLIGFALNAIGAKNAPTNKTRKKTLAKQPQKPYYNPEMMLIPPEEKQITVDDTTQTALTQKPLAEES